VVSRERQEHVVEAGLVDRQRRRGELGEVQPPEDLDQHARTVVRAETDRRGLAFDLVAVGELRPGPLRRILVVEAELGDRAPELGLQHRRRVVRDHVPVVDHRHPSGELVRLLQVLGGEENGGAVAHQLSDHVPELVPAEQVEAGRRLVQEEHRRTRHQGGCDVQSPPHPTRVRPGRSVGGVEEVEAAEQLVRARRDRSGNHLREHADQPQVLPPGEVGVDRRELAGQADHAAHRVG
jgi:hypothetical protein